MDNHVFAGSERIGEGELAKREGGTLKGAVRYFSFKGNERYSEFIKSKGQLGFQPDSIFSSVASLCYAVHYALHYIRHVFPSENALARNLEQCMRGWPRVTHRQIDFLTMLYVILYVWQCRRYSASRIRYRLVAQAFSRKGSSLALCRWQSAAAFARSYNLHRALGDFLGEQGFWPFRERNIKNFSCNSKSLRIARVVHREEWYN